MDDEQQQPHRAWVQELVCVHQDALLRYAHSIVIDRDAAGDIVQETFMQLCRQPRASLEGHEAAWLFRVCHNTAVSRQRKEKRMHALHPEFDPQAGGRSPEQEASAADELHWVWACIGQLPENQQLVVRLKFLCGMTYREISSRTGLSETNVGFLLHTALKSLRTRMTTNPTPRAAQS